MSRFSVLLRFFSGKLANAFVYIVCKRRVVFHTCHDAVFCGNYCRVIAVELLTDLFERKIRQLAGQINCDMPRIDKLACPLFAQNVVSDNAVSLCDIVKYVFGCQLASSVRLEIVLQNLFCHIQRNLFAGDERLSPELF